MGATLSAHAGAGGDEAGAWLESVEDTLPLTFSSGSPRSSASRIAPMSPARSGQMKMQEVVAPELPVAPQQTCTEEPEVACVPVFPMLLGAPVQQLGAITISQAVPAVPIPCDVKRSSSMHSSGLSSSPVAVLAAAFSSDGISSDDEFLRDKSRKSKLASKQAFKRSSRSLAALHASANWNSLGCN